MAVLWYIIKRYKIPLVVATVSASATNATCLITNMLTFVVVFYDK